MADRDPATGRFLPGNKVAKGHKRWTKDKEIKMLEAFHDVVKDEDWKCVIRVALRKAKQGDRWAREWLSDRILGKPLQQVDIHASRDEPDDIIDVWEEKPDLIEE